MLLALQQNLSLGSVVACTDNPKKKNRPTLTSQAVLK